MTQQTLIEMAAAELKQQTALLSELKTIETSFTKGRLFVRRGSKGTSYFQRLPGSADDIKLDPAEPRDAKTIERLAEKSVLRRGLPRLEKNINALERFLKAFDVYDPRSYPNGGLVKDDFCLPGETDWAKWSRDTERGDYRTNQRYSEYKIYDTIRGDAVRSKSEAMIADYYYHRGWLYRYEGEMVFGGKAICPDFQFLHPVTRELIIHEHFGLLHRSDYVENCLWKLMMFARDGFRMGSNLIVTWETAEEPLTLGRIKAGLESVGIEA